MVFSMKRLFIAVKIPDFQRVQMEILLGGLPGASFTKTENLHLTLRFIGNFEEDLIDELCQELNVLSRFGAFNISCDGLGTFGSSRRPKVLWISVKESLALLSLKKRCDRILDSFNFERSARNYRPHITIARFRKNPGASLKVFIESKGAFSYIDFKATELCLFSSKLSSKGAIYEEIYSVNLKESDS